MDELERRIRAARPMSGHRDLPLTSRAKQELADLVLSRPNATLSRARAASRQHDRRRMTRRLVAASTGIAMVAAATAVVLNILVPSGSAQAVTPAPLVTTAIGESTTETLEGLEMVKQADDAAPQHTVRLQSWELHTEIGDEGSIVSSSVEPHWSETTFADDGSVRILLTAADPFPGQDAEGLPTPGTVLADETLEPGEYVSTYDEAVPTDPAEIDAYLAQYAGEESPLTAGAAIREISGLLSSIIVTTEQETAIIAYLQTLDGLTVAGTVIDRLGREGIAFSAADRRPGEYQDYLILSPDTGSIIAAETVYIGSERTDITSPSVIDYVAWER
ncbi:MAG: hypothetical protein QM602_07885 [Microbacterium sp.]